MKKALMAAAALVALPVMAQAQSPSPGVYIGAEGGVNWLLNFTANTNIPAFPTVSVYPQTGWAAGGVIGYDFVGPDRMLYSSDHPWVDPKLIRDNILSLKLPPQDEAKLFSGNAKRLFGL